MFTSFASASFGLCFSCFSSLIVFFSLVCSLRFRPILCLFICDVFCTFEHVVGMVWNVIATFEPDVCVRGFADLIYSNYFCIMIIVS